MDIFNNTNILCEMQSNADSERISVTAGGVITGWQPNNQDWLSISAKLDNKAGQTWQKLKYCVDHVENEGGIWPFITWTYDGSNLRYGGYFAAIENALPYDVILQCGGWNHLIKTGSGTNLFPLAPGQIYLLLSKTGSRPVGLLQNMADFNTLSSTNNIAVLASSGIVIYHKAIAGREIFSLAPLNGKN